MRRVVFDANVLISGVMARNRPESTMRQIIRAWEEDRFELITSRHLLVEVERHLNRLHVGGRVTREDRDEAIALLREESHTSPITIEVVGVATHPEDDVVVATAVSAQADCLVTGDKQLVALGSYAGIPIITPRQFLNELENE